MRSTSAPARPRRQRLWGLLVLLVVAVSALVLAQLLHPPVAGSASRGPVPDPPAVGDCLLDPTVIGQQHFEGTTLIHPWLRTGPCRGRRFGEVAALLTPPDLPRAPVSTGPSTHATGSPIVRDPYIEPCGVAMSVWVGLPTGDRVVGQWSSDQLTVALVLSGPSQLQRGSGQDWTACIAVAGGGPGASNTTAGYDSTAHSMINPGPPLPVFAVCMPAVGDEQVPCTTAHTAELLGSIVSPRGVTEQDRRGCRALAQQLTGMPDPTAGGRITVSVADSGGAIDGRHALYCWMVTVSPHQLTGPLLGLSDRPIPIT